MFQPQVILHPTDFSACSSHAFDLAVDLARQYHARLLILHVAETLGPENVTFGEVASQLEPAGYRNRLAQDLRRQVAAPADLEVEYLLTEGDPTHEIEHIARTHRADLIVMGTQGLTGLRRLLMGSIAEKVIRLASCPVLTSKPAH